MDLLPSPAGSPQPAASPHSFLKFSSQGGASQQVLRKLSCLPKGQNPAFSQSQSTGLPQETYCPSAVPWTQPVAKTHGSRPGKRGGLSPSAGQLGECRPHPLPLQSRLRSLLPVLLKALHYGNSNASKPGSQHFYSPNFRTMSKHVAQNLSRNTLQGSHQKADIQVVPR